MSPLFNSILSGCDLSPLLSEGHCVNVYGDFPGVSWTPLHVSVFRCLPRVAALLLEAGAQPNSEALASALPGPYRALVGMTAVDLAVTLDSQELVAMLVRAGGRPGRQAVDQTNHSRLLLRTELARARAVGAAEGLVAEPILLPLVERAQQEGDWDEADRLLRRILSHEGESEQTQHRLIRGYLARGRRQEALEEASLVFLAYRRQGSARTALQVARNMRMIDPEATRPYELELNLLTELGRVEEARGCLQQLQSLHWQAGCESEVRASQARFDLLCRRPKNRQPSRLPQPWKLIERERTGSNPANLPAVPETRSDPRSWWQRLWWGGQDDVSE